MPRRVENSTVRSRTSSSGRAVMAWLLDRDAHLRLDCDGRCRGRSATSPRPELLDASTTSALPLPACGERVGVRGRLVKFGPLTFANAPPPSSLREATSPRTRQGYRI